MKYICGMKKLFFILLSFFALIQVIRPTKNQSDDNTFHIKNNYTIQASTHNILNNACYDCHSNKTNYPWYAEIAPTSWLLSNHINEGKKHLNFSEFTNRPLAFQYHKLEECIELIENKEMPLASYTYLGMHKNAKLTENERKELITWATGIKMQMEEKYPKDSFIRKRRK